jgi:glycosyltransferase involved in cell wall biosynthesis
VARILQLITDPRRRGAQVFAYDLESELTARGHSVSTVALWQMDTTNPLPVRSLGRKRGWRTMSFLGPLIQLSHDYEVVVAHGASTLMAATLLRVARPSGPVVVYRQISDLQFWAGHGLRHLRTRLYLTRADCVVALWQGSAEVLEARFRVPVERIRVIPNGSSSSWFRPCTPTERGVAREQLDLAPSELVTAYVGALVREKGVDLVIRAMDEVPGTLMVAGEGPGRGMLEKLTSEAASGRVRFLGQVADTRAIYWASDVVVLPSRGGDSMPGTLIEAGLCGVPCVATAVDGIPEIVIAGVTGVITEPGTADLARSLQAAHESRIRLGLAARNHCQENFSLESVGERWSNLITELAQGRGHGA